MIVRSHRMLIRAFPPAASSADSHRSQSRKSRQRNNLTFRETLLSFHRDLPLRREDTYNSVPTNLLLQRNGWLENLKPANLIVRTTNELIRSISLTCCTCATVMSTWVPSTLGRRINLYWHVHACSYFGARRGLMRRWWGYPESYIVNNRAVRERFHRVFPPIEKFLFQKRRLKLKFQRWYRKATRAFAAKRSKRWSLASFRVLG